MEVYALIVVCLLMTLTVLMAQDDHQNWKRVFSWEK